VVLGHLVRAAELDDVGVWVVVQELDLLQVVPLVPLGRVRHPLDGHLSHWSDRDSESKN
jgi:hypothetical protein